MRPKTIPGAQTFEEKSQASKAVQPPKEPQCLTPASDMAKENNENGWWPRQIARYNVSIQQQYVTLNDKKALFTSKMSIW